MALSEHVRHAPLRPSLNFRLTVLHPRQGRQKLLCTAASVAALVKRAMKRAMSMQPRTWWQQVLQGRKGRGGRQVHVIRWSRVGCRWKRKEVTKLLEKNGQRHQSCHFIYKQWRNRYDVRGGRLRDYGGGAPARTSAATQSECPFNEAI